MRSTKIKIESGGIKLVALIFLLIVSVVSIVAFYSFGIIVKPNQIGLRQNFFAVGGILEEGFSSKGLEPGLHWKIPYVSTVHILPRDFLLMNFNEEQISGDLQLPRLLIPTEDGSKVRADITLVTRLYDKPEKIDSPTLIDRLTNVEKDDQVPLATKQNLSHGGPKDFINLYSFLQGNHLKMLAYTVEKYIKQSLARLYTVDYYNPVKREAAALDANDLINQDVSGEGIEVWATLVRRYVYDDEVIDNTIFLKNLEEQKERRIAAESKLEEVRAKTEQDVARLTAEIDNLRVEGEEEAKTRISQADLLYTEVEAEGNRVIEEAKAKAEELQNKILTDTPGAQVYLAKEFVPLLNSLKGGVVTEIDPFDIDAWVNKLIKHQTKEKKNEVSEN
jgi:regulator of protease activity HflC (stomatin/prohibitin superfamily)